METVDRTTQDGLGLADPQLRSLLQALQSAPPLPPLQFAVEKVVDGSVRVTVVNDGLLGGRLNGAIRFDVYFADDVDNTSVAGKAAGFARATCLAPSIPATQVDHTQSSGTFSDPKYATGWFYVCGVDAQGNVSAPSEPAQITTGPVDLTIPGPVEGFQVSESGVLANGTVLSELSVTCNPPSNPSGFGGLQLYLKDYTSLGSIQEGYFHKFLGSGAINFDVDYPIPRRKGTFAIDLTNASVSVTAASGFLAIAQAGDQLELAGRRITIDGVTDTVLTLHAAWDLTTMTADPTLTTPFVPIDWSIIALVTIYGVSVGLGGARRDDPQNAPSAVVLMDGNTSPPNRPAAMYISNTGVSVLIEWDQVTGQTINGYNVYRSDGSGLDTGMLQAPPQPTAGTKFLGNVPQNPNLPTGSTYARMQYHDSNFTRYDLEANSAFVWYVTTTNVRGDESAANYAGGNCQRAASGDIDPTLVGRNPGKNLLYNGALAGTVGNVVLANDTSQDAFMGLAGTDAPGKPYGAASGQANGAGRFEGYTRWESTDAGLGSAGSVKHQAGDEIHMLPPGINKSWYLIAEIGAWDEATNKRKKVGKGEVYTLSVYLNHAGVTPNGVIHLYVEQYNNNNPKGQSLRRYRDTNSSILTSSTPLTVTCSDLTATMARFQAPFQLDAATSPTAQIRVNFEWADGTTGEVVLRRAMLNPGEVAAQWTADMGDPAISLPVPTYPMPPLGDTRTVRAGDGYRYIP